MLFLLPTHHSTTTNAGTFTEEAASILHHLAVPGHRPTARHSPTIIAMGLFREMVIMSTRS